MGWWARARSEGRPSQGARKPATGADAEAAAVAARAQDAALMARVAAGDMTAQRALATRLSPRAERTLAALLRNSADVEDVLHEGFVEVLRAARGYRGEASIETWADRIFVRRALRWRKAERRFRAPLLTDVPLEIFAAPTGPVPLSERMAKPVEHYLSRLSEPLRVSLLLRYGAGHSVPEIAAATGASVKRAEKRVLAALAKLRVLIAKDAGERRVGRAR